MSNMAREIANDMSDPRNWMDDDYIRHCRDCDCEIDLNEMNNAQRSSVSHKEKFLNCYEHLFTTADLREEVIRWKETSLFHQKRENELQAKVRELESALRYKESLLADIFGGLDDFMKKYGGEK